MKKFLFTLAALLMVGTAVADDYWYIDDFEVPQSAVGSNIEVIVKAHFDNAVAAAQIDFTFPEGMVLRKIDQGTDFTNMMYHDDWGDTWAASQTVFVGRVASNNVGWAFADMDYYYDEASGSWLEAGSVKFLPGEYSDQIKLTIRVTDAFQGGTITVHSEPSCTYDNRPDVHPCPEGQKIDKVCTVTLEGATPQLEDLTGNIVVSQPDDNGVVTVTYNGPEEVTITVNDQPVVADGYQLEDGVPMTFNVTVSAEGYNDLTASETRTWNKPAPADLTGNIVFGEVDQKTGKFTVDYDGTEEGVAVEVTGCEKVRGIEYQLPEFGTYTVTAKATLAGYNDKVATATKTWSQYVTPAPTVTVDDDSHPSVITATGEGTITIYMNDQAVATGVGQATYTIDWPAYGEGHEMYYNGYATAVSTEYPSAAAGLTDFRVYVGVQDPVTPPEPGETTTFVKVTSTDQFVAGQKYVFVCNGYAMGALNDAGRGVGVAVTVNGDEVEVGDDVLVFTLGGSFNLFTLEYADGFLKPTASNQTSFTTGTSNNQWKSAAANGGYAMLSDMTDSKRGIIFQTGTSLFGHYAKSNVGDGYEYALIYVEKSEAPVLKDLTGEIVVSQPDENGVVTVTYTGEEDVTITVNGEPVAESYQLENGVPMTFDVVVSADGYNDLTASETRTWNKPAPKELKGEIVVSQPDDNGVVTVSYVPGEGDPEVTITVNDQPVVADGYQLEDGVPMTFNVTVSAEGYNDLTATETRTWNKPQPKELTGEIVVSEPDANGVVTVTYNGPEEVTITVNDEPVAESYQLEDGVPMEFNVVVSAEGYNDLTASETRTWNKPAPKQLEGHIVFSAVNQNDGSYTVTYDGPEEGVVVEVVSETPKNRAADALPDYGTYTVTAKASKEGYNDLVESAELTWERPLQDLTGQIVVSQPDANGVVTVTYTGTEDVTILVNGEPVVADGYQLEDGVETTFNVVVSADGYNNLTASEKRTWNKPVVIGAPTFQGYSQDGITGYGVNITPTTTGSEIMYVVYIYNEETQTWDALTDWTEYEGTENEIWYTEEGKYKVDAYAYIGQNQSQIVSYEFTVVPATPTSIDEMNAGKSIAGVRYFNMAGQEMQEANGVTIVVTTYTDGTTSAVKVMK